MKIKAVIWQEDNVWCASVPALPGCHTWGESYEQLLEMLEDAVQGWLEVASEQAELASEQTELEPEKKLVELSYEIGFWQSILQNCRTAWLETKTGYW